MSPAIEPARILVIDDVSEELQTINAALSKQAGFETHGLNHGDAAFEHMETSPRLPDLILLDVHMPGMSGLEVLAGLKMDPRWSDIPVILMTASAGNDEEQGFELGASDWIQKPIQPGQLIVRIHNQLKLHRQKQRTQQLTQQASSASSNAIHDIAHNLLGHIDAVQTHWNHFLKNFSNETDICSPQMQEEMPALLHELRADVTRIVRITEGV